LKILQTLDLHNLETFSKYIDPYMADILTLSPEFGQSSVGQVLPLLAITRGEGLCDTTFFGPMQGIK
jgi:hypothetical protein